MPITQLIKALYYFEKGRGRHQRKLSECAGRRVLETVADEETGEVIVAEGKVLSREDAAAIAPEYAGRKVLVETPLGTNEDILKIFTNPVTLKEPEMEQLVGRTATADLTNAEGQLILRQGDTIEKETARLIASMELAEFTVIETLPLAKSTLDADPTQNAREALLDIYKRLRPGEAANEDAAKQLVYGLFFDVKRYDLGKVGRRFLNQKLGIDLPLDARHLTAEDLITILVKMVPYVNREADRDDIDDLKNKRVRSVGELLQSQLRLGFVRMEKVARERMTSTDQENLLPGIILSVKPVSASIKSFFSSNQLSTFMDQTNPLSEITNKRRLSSLGPGGLQRNSAKLEVRDVHRSHYGRICPIETPEGPNIGLISQLTSHARVDEFGFIQTPYRLSRTAWCRTTSST